jgi:hypothetical protein
MLFLTQPVDKSLFSYTISFVLFDFDQGVTIQYPFAPPLAARSKEALGDTSMPPALPPE